MSVLVDCFDSPASTGLVASTIISTNWIVHDSLWGLLNASAILASHCSRLQFIGESFKSHNGWCGVVISIHCLNSPACMAPWLFLCLTSRRFTRKWKISKVKLQIRFVLFLEPSLWNNYWKKEPLFIFWEHLCSLSLCVLLAFRFLKTKPFWSLCWWAATPFPTFGHRCGWWDLCYLLCSCLLLLTSLILFFLYGFQSLLSLGFHSCHCGGSFASHPSAVISAQMVFSNEK